MDKNLEILLGSDKNVNSTTIDTYDQITLDKKSANIVQYDISNVLSVAKVYEQERENTEKYRIYGELEWFSMLNGLKTNYDKLNDFFLPYYDGYSYKDIYSSIDLYLVRPASGFKRLSTNYQYYRRDFEVIATPDQFELHDAGYSKNLFYNKKHIYTINTDIDVTNFRDSFGYPPTELFIYAQYNRGTNGVGKSETVKSTDWSTITQSAYTKAFSSQTLEIGDIIEGDKIEESYSEYKYEQIEQQIHYISTSYVDTDDKEQSLSWKYNPFIPLRLRYFSNEISRGNESSTAYDQKEGIPDYASNVGDDNYIWREILQQGYIDPLSGEGVDYPFLNGNRYLFTSSILDIPPDLSDTNTAEVFDQINFATPTILNISPEGDINDIGKPC
jgi:hypothetical protein